MLYPPESQEGLQKLLDAIESSQYDVLKKDCLVYFLLKWHQDGRERNFAVQRCIPPQFSSLADAYWHLDTGINVAVSTTVAVCRPATTVLKYRTESCCSSLRLTSQSRLRVQNHSCNLSFARLRCTHSKICTDSKATARRTTGPRSVWYRTSRVECYGGLAILAYFQ